MTDYYTKLCKVDTLYSAWLDIKKKKSAGGIDGHDIKSFARNEDKYLNELNQQLQSRAYLSEPYFHIKVPKSVGTKEKRSLGLLSIRDKVVQQAVRNLIEPLFEKQFLDISYGYRPEKGPARAINRVRHRIVSERRTWVTICDIDNFFDTVNHSILFDKIKATIQETEILDLIRMWTRMGQVDKLGVWKDREQGIAQGGILSPLFSNVYLHEFDVFMVKQNYGIIRYSDDFIILSHDSDTAYRALKDTQDYLTNQLKLKLNPDHSVRSVQQGFTYMGFFFKGDTLQIDNGKFHRLKTKIKLLCIDYLHKPLSDFVEKANQQLQTINSYYRQLAPEYQLQALEDYLKLQVTILIRKKRNNGELKSRPDTFHELKKLKTILPKPYEKLKEFTNTILDDAWRDKRKPAPKKPRSQKQDSTPPEAHQEKLPWYTTAPETKEHQPEKQDLAQQKPPQTSPKETKTLPEDKKPDDIDKSKEIKSADRKIKKKKREYLKKRIAVSNLILTRPGHFVGSSKGMIIIKEGRNVVKKISPSKVEHISVMSRGVTISSDVIHLCAEKKIPIDFFNFKGEPTAKIFLPELPDTEIGLAQLKAFENGKCYRIAISIVESKIGNTLNVLKYFLRHRKRADKDFCLKCESAFAKIEKAQKKVLHLEKIEDLDLFRNRLLAHEAEAATAYWDAVRMLLEDDVVFEKRIRQGATDVVNSSLNYGYGILYPRLWQAVIQAGLNPTISYIHKPQSGKPTLTYDLIEEFRQQVVDRPVFALFTKGKELRTADGLLSTSTRNTVLNTVINRLKTTIRFRGSKMTFEEIMLRQAKHLAEFLLDKRKTYNPFVGSY